MLVYGAPSGFLGNGGARRANVFVIILLKKNFITCGKPFEKVIFIFFTTKFWFYR